MFEDQYEKYTIQEHRYRFAIWSAARAIQRGFAVKAEFIYKAIEQSGLRELVNDQRSWPKTFDEYDIKQKEICNNIISYFKEINSKVEVTYGRAAKAVAVYLKSSIVLAGFHETAFAKIIHPPIDRNVLQNLAAKLKGIDSGLAKYFKTINWTQLDENEYFKLIDRLREANLHLPAFWKLEAFWMPSEDDDEGEDHRKSVSEAFRP